MNIKRPHYEGFGSKSQLLSLVAVASSAYSLWSQIGADRAQQAAMASATREQVIRFAEVDKETTVEISRIRDGQRDLRRDLETEYRREIDLACSCCKTIRENP